MGKAKKEKSVKNKFRIDGNNGEYSFQLKKKPNLWWLLLLLLPLLLLVPLKKDITVYTRMDGSPEPFVDVSMNYTARYLLWDKKFNVKIPYDTIQQTDSVGKTVFKRLGYSVYSFLFHFNAPVVFSAGGDGYYDSISKTCRFHTTRKVVLDLSSRRCDLTFSTIETVNGDPLGLLPDCDLIVTVDGNRVQPTNSGNGEFTVENLHPNSVISIEASKQYYNTNNTKVNNCKVGDLMNAPQDDRDIPLEIERACGELFCSGAPEYDSQTRIPFLHLMGKPSGRFKFMFRTRELPDELEVWNCRPEEISTADRSKCLLFKWSLTDGNGGCTPDGYRNGERRPGLKPVTKWLNYDNGPYITVVGIREGNDSDFEYVVCCPDEDCDVEWPLYAKVQPVQPIDTSLFRILPAPDPMPTPGPNPN